MVRPADRATRRAPYRVPAPGGPITLDLRGNEGAAPPALDIALTGELLRRYPAPAALEARIAARFGLDPACVLVTAGGDDALDRLCRATLQPGRELVLPVPAFEMTRRWAELAGAAVVEVAWPGAAFPLGEAVAAVGPCTGLVALTSPNNPTGAVITPTELAEVAAAASRVEAGVLVDLAYAEYAEQDLTEAALACDNTVVVRTLSKAFGVAGARVGYALGPTEVIGWMRSVGAPYAVSAPSLAVATAVLDADLSSHLAQVHDARTHLADALTAAGCTVVPSQANFVFARSPDRAGLVARLAERGIAVRTFDGRPGLEDALRIGIPPHEQDLRIVLDVLQEAP